MTPTRLDSVPESIKKPDYYSSPIGEPKSESEARYTKFIVVNDATDIQSMREACLIGRKALDLGGHMVKPGVTTESIDKAIHEFIIKEGAYPSPLNYRRFPKSICSSINEVICHGIPDDRPLQEGDIVNLDVSVYHKGVHADLNETYAVGEVAESSKHLVSLFFVAHSFAFLSLASRLSILIALLKRPSKFASQGPCTETLGTRLRPTSKSRGFQWFEITAGMESGGCFTRRPMSLITPITRPLES